MASQIEICNWALGLVSENRINDIDDETEPARLCLLHYEQTIAEVLAKGKWRSARARAELTQLSAAPEFGWAYQYELPVDYVRMVEFNDLETNETELDLYEIEGRRLLTDETTASIIYVAMPETPDKFSPALTELVYTMLAAKLAYPLTRNSSRQQELIEAFERKLPSARTSDSMNARVMVPDQRPASKWYRSRFGSTAG